MSGTIERGALYMNAGQRKAWQRVLGIVHERRTEDEALELIARAMRLAIEHQIAQKDRA
jgi:hypothetical protein